MVPKTGTGMPPTPITRDREEQHAAHDVPTWRSPRNQPWNNGIPMLGPKSCSPLVDLGYEPCFLCRVKRLIPHHHLKDQSIAPIAPKHLLRGLKDLRVSSTEGRSVCLCWEHSKPQGRKASCGSRLREGEVIASVGLSQNLKDLKDHPPV